MILRLPQSFAEILALAKTGEWGAAHQLLETIEVASYSRDCLGGLLVSLAGLECAAPLLRTLATMGADPNFRCSDGSTALGAAIGGGSEHGITTLPELNALLDVGADPKQIGESGYPALHWAITHARFKHAKVLLERGADPNQLTADLKPETAFDVATRMRSSSGTKLLEDFTLERTSRSPIGD